MFFEQLKELCEAHGTTVTAVTVKLGISKGAMSQWKKGSSPNGDTLLKFSEYFNVSTDYLLTGKKSNLTITENEKENEEIDEGRKNGIDANSYELLKFIGKKQPVSKYDVDEHYGKDSHFAIRFNRMVEALFYLEIVPKEFSATEYAKYYVFQHPLEERRIITTNEQRAIRCSELYNVDTHEFMREIENILLNDIENKEKFDISDVEEKRYRLSEEAIIAITDYEAEQNEKREQVKMIAEELFILQNQKNQESIPPKNDTGTDN